MRTGVFCAIEASGRTSWDPIKYIPLRRSSPDWYMTFSGEAREVWEQTGNNNWGQQPFWNGFFLERYMLGIDAHYGKHFRTFVQFKSGLESFRIGGPRPIDEKKLDFQNAFLRCRNRLASRTGSGCESADRSWSTAMGA